MRHVCLILNPCSGANRRRPWLRERLEKWADEAGLAATIQLTTHAGDALEISKACAGRFDCVAAVGGDGTVNEIAIGAQIAGLPLGIIPCGSGNGLARHLGIPMNLKEALGVLASGKVRRIDSGFANGHRFFNAMGVGIDAEICRRFNMMSKRGLVRYVDVGTRVYAKYLPQRYTVSTGGKEIEIKALSISIMNSDQFGNNARIAPGARIDDGELDLVAIHPAHLLASAALAVRMFHGSADKSPSVTRIAGSRFKITGAQAGVIHVDGETRSSDAVIEVEIEPLSLAVIVPDRH